MSGLNLEYRKPQAPPIELQNKFAERPRVDELKAIYQRAYRSGSLYGASQQAFKGELTFAHNHAGHKPEEKTVKQNLTYRRKTFTLNFPISTNGLMENDEVRAALIAQWLEAYRGQLGSKPFSVQDFMTAAQTRLATNPDTTLRWAPATTNASRLGCSRHWPMAG